MASGSFKTGWGQYTKDYELIVEWSSTSNIAANTSTVTAVIKFYCPYACNLNKRYSNIVSINGVNYEYDSPAINTDGGETFTLATITSGAIAHNADGSKSIAISAQFRFNASLSGVSYGVQTASNTVALDNIPRAATLVFAPNFNDEENPTITYSNPAGNAVSALKACISFTGEKDDIVYRDIPKTGTSYTFTLTDAERNVLRNGTTTSNSRTVYFYLATTISGRIYRVNAGKTLSIINASPVLAPTAKDTGSVSTKLTGDAENIMIKGYNVMEVAANATPQKGATIKSYNISCGGKSITTATGRINYVSDNNIVFSVTDSRGNTTTKTITKTLIDYHNLTCNLSVAAPTTTGETALKINGIYFNGSFGATDNTLTVEYRYKVNSGEYGEWIAAEATASNNTYTSTVSLTGLDYLNSYTFEARAKDLIHYGGITTPEQRVKTMPVFDWGENDFNFNVPVSFNGVVMNDFIVEQGTASDWFYRKWNSGIAECWRVYYKTGVNASQNNYNNYYYSSTITVSYPFTFTNIPCLQANGGSSSNMNFARVFGQYEDAASFVICGHAADATNTNITVNLYAIGRWK